jgi:hypothetical protein
MSTRSRKLKVSSLCRGKYFLKSTEAFSRSENTRVLVVVIQTIAMLSWLFFLFVWPVILFFMTIGLHSGLDDPPYRSFFIRLIVGLVLSMGFSGMAFSPVRVMGATKKWRAINVALLTLPLFYIFGVITFDFFMIIVFALIALPILIVLPPIIWPSWTWFKKREIR